MKIAPINACSSVSFKRHLSQAEEREMELATTQAKKLLGNTGNSVLIVHDACLPQSAGVNTGVGNLLGEDSDKFFRFAKTYFGINTVEVLPQGEFIKKNSAGMVCAYGYSALGLNNDLINPHELTKPEWGSIVTPAEVEAIVAENKGVDTVRLVNYDNINSPDSKFQKTLKNAFKRFMALDSEHLLRLEFEQFRHDNSDWLEPKAVYSILKRKNGGRNNEEWPEAEKNLYSMPDDVRRVKIDAILSENWDEAEFFAFKQFMAEKHLHSAKEQLHAKGLKLFGDMAITFSPDEVWANPKAFLSTHYIGANNWYAPCLRFSRLSDETSEPAQLLKRKAGLMARRYDGIRFDVSWMYVKPRMFNKNIKHWERLDMGDAVLRLIESEVKRVKGEEYRPQDFIHEFKAGGDDFIMIDRGTPHSVLSGRVAILESEFMDSSWGSNHYFSKILSQDGYIMGLGDHTSQPLVQLALGMRDNVEESKSGGKAFRKNVQVSVLADIFGSTAENMARPYEFIRAKFADIMGAKHNFVFYMDALGRSSRFDSQGYNSDLNYCFKISPNFVDDYHKQVQKGFALNLPDVLAKAFEKEGLNSSHKDLYEKLVKLANILKEPEAAVKSNIKGEEKIKSAFNWKYGGLAILALGLVGFLGYIYHSKKVGNPVDTSR